MLVDIYNRDIRNLTISEELLTILANNFVKLHHVENYVKKIKFFGDVKNDASLAYYNSIDKFIVMNAQKQLEEELNSPSRVLLFNQGYEKEVVELGFKEVFHTLYHELTHAEQNKIICEKKGLPIIRKILEDTSYYHNCLDYSSNHNIYPDEHNADAEAAIEVQNLSKILEIKEENKTLISYLLDSYELQEDHIVSPTSLFYQKLDIPFAIENIDPFVSLLYGLPIDINLYNKLRNKSNTSNDIKKLIR